ncbi:MAG: hypothetical protein ACI8QS_003392 [Planctomycetota bacterium]|jgi:hypothetical protein
MVSIVRPGAPGSKPSCVIRLPRMGFPSLRTLSAPSVADCRLPQSSLVPLQLRSKMHNNHSKLSHPMFVIGSFAFLLGMTACSGAGTSLSPEWQAQAVWTAPAKLGGCAVGDIIPQAEGQEIVAVSITGEIHLLQRNGEGWDARLLAQTPGELIQVAVGDADPTSPGLEILAVGMKAGVEEDGGTGMAWLVSDINSPSPILTPLFEDSALIHGGCIADVDPDRPGEEIVVAGFGKKVHVLSFDGAGYFQEVAGELSGPAKQVVAWNGGIAVACSNGELVFLTKENQAWNSRVLATAPAGLARLGPSSEHLLVARDDGILWELDTAGAGREIHRESEKLRGAVHADLDPDIPGLEYASAGYEGRIVILAEAAPGEFLSVDVWQSDQRFHHLTSGEVDSAGIGFELIGCGYSGEVVLVRRTKVVH